MNISLELKLRSFIQKWLPRFLKNNQFYYRLRTWVHFQYFLKKRLGKQLSFRNKAPREKYLNGKKILVPIIETSHYQHQQILAVAKALEIRGAEVKVLICGESLIGCEVKSIRNSKEKDPCWSCRFNTNKTVPIFNLETVKLADFLSKEDTDRLRQEADELVVQNKSVYRLGINLDNAIKDSVVRYYYGDVPKECSQTIDIKKQHTFSALMTAEIAARLDRKWKPDAVLSHMYVYSPWEAFYRYYKKNGDRYRTISINPFNFNAITLDILELYKKTRFQNYLKIRNNSKLSSIEKNELERFLRDRFAGNSRIFLKEGYYASINSNSLKKINLNRKKRNIFLFSNVFWDAGLNDMAGLYSGCIEWVLSTIELLKNHKEIQLYIKPHPAEVYDSSNSLKGVREIIQETYEKLPSNVTIIEPEWKIKPYDLFKYIDLGVVYSGTVGLEMLMAKVPVVTTGISPFHGLGFAFEPKNEKQYLDSLLGKMKPMKISITKLEIFAYFYLIRCCMPFNITKQAYGDSFTGFKFDSLEDLKPKKNPILDHLCRCIADKSKTTVEAWPDSI